MDRENGKGNGNGLFKCSTGESVCFLDIYAMKNQILSIASLMIIIYQSRGIP